MVISLEQIRAEYALDCIKEALDKYKNSASKLKSYINSAPSMILKNGLANTIAFYKSKYEGEKKLSADKQAYKLLTKCIEGWLKEREIVLSNSSILKWFSDKSTSSIQVLHATDETLRMLNWLKMIAKSKIETNEGEEE